MKTYIRLLAIASLVAAGSGTALHAQTSDTVTSVPFEFTVGTASLPRDSYRVSQVTGKSEVFMISGFRGAAIVITQPEGLSRAGETPQLVFVRYGDRHFLREIRVPGGAGFSVPQSGRERDAAARMAAGTKPEVIVVRSGHDRAQEAARAE